MRKRHGDLHWGNLVLLADGLQLFAAIEFSEALRFIEPIADVALMHLGLDTPEPVDWAALLPAATHQQAEAAQKN